MRSTSLIAEDRTLRDKFNAGSLEMSTDEFKLVRYARRNGFKWSGQTVEGIDSLLFVSNKPLTEKQLTAAKIPFDFLTKKHKKTFTIHKWQEGRTCIMIPRIGVRNVR